MDQDDALILRCRTDPEAFRALVVRFEARIYSFLIRLVGRDAAEDLFQEVWLRVYENADRYEARGRAISWFFKIANNLAMHHWEKSGRRRHASMEGAAERVADPAAQPPEAAERGEALRRVSEAVERLPAEQRQVFLMREYGRLSFKEISETLEIPLGTALSRMNYALEKLKKLLEDSHG
ncbi:MAG: sigma-70 family RNA polymerase sigma factor [Proteobacteria bacterium]|nr:sigma-70 family RNA polymerase sigma factor [Pseudomonadota bacterium]